MHIRKDLTDSVDVYVDALHVADEVIRLIGEANIDARLATLSLAMAAGSLGAVSGVERKMIVRTLTDVHRESSWRTFEPFPTTARGGV